MPRDKGLVLGGHRDEEIILVHANRDSNGKVTGYPATGIYVPVQVDDTSSSLRLTQKIEFQEQAIEVLIETDVLLDEGTVVSDVLKWVAPDRVYEIRGIRYADRDHRESILACVWRKGSAISKLNITEASP